MKKQQKKSQAVPKGLKILGLGAGGLVGLFVLAFFALPAVCPSCASWIGLLSPGEPSTVQVETKPGEAVQAQPLNDKSVPVGTKVGERAPEFALTDIDGKEFQLSEFRGKPTIVYFSASWCTSCIPETQKLAQLKAGYRDLEIVWISVDPAGDSPASLREFRQKYAREDFIFAIDTPSNDVVKQYQVYALGDTYLLDRDQLIVFRGVRPVGSQAFKQALERLVGADVK